ncbi:MAG: hypothetical protein JO340_02915 [Acidobacteriaceae bacterium]|nr:hypothetical protein [Acidobacteriaceae bacterium]
MLDQLPRQSASSPLSGDSEDFASSPDSSAAPPPHDPPGNPIVSPHVPRFRRATGPLSREGKAVSSMNRLSHGCRSNVTVLPDEDPVEFEATIRDWFDAYGPQDPVAARLVEDTALADWFLRRNRKRLDQIEQRLPKDAWHWTDSNLKLYNNFLRYKTTAERSFLRAFRELEIHVRRDAQDAEANQRALAQSARIFIRWINRTAALPQCDRMRVRQWVEIEKTPDGVRASLSPTNEQIQKRVAARPKPPTFLTRTLNFTHGVPPEYAWAFPDEVQQLTGALAEQTVLYEDWLRLIERESSYPAGHIGPTDWLFEL